MHYSHIRSVFIVLITFFSITINAEFISITNDGKLQMQLSSGTVVPFNPSRARSWYKAGYQLTAHEQKLKNEFEKLAMDVQKKAHPQEPPVSSKLLLNSFPTTVSALSLLQIQEAVNVIPQFSQFGFNGDLLLFKPRNSTQWLHFDVSGPLDENRRLVLERIIENEIEKGGVDKNYYNKFKLQEYLTYLKNKPKLVQLSSVNDFYQEKFGLSPITSSFSLASLASSLSQCTLTNCPQVTVSGDKIKIAINNISFDIADIKNLVDQQNEIISNSEINNQFINDAQLLKQYGDKFKDSNNETKHILNYLTSFANKENLAAILKGGTGDIIGLANYTTSVYYPINHLFRLKLVDKTDLENLKSSFIFTFKNKLNDNDNANNLSNASIFSPGSRYKKIFAEALLHGLMVQNALLKHKNYKNKVYRIIELTSDDFNNIVKIKNKNELYVNKSFTSTGYNMAGADQYARKYQKYLFEITPRQINSAGKVLDGTVKDNKIGVDNSAESEVLFLLGSAFTITNISENDPTSKFIDKNDNDIQKNRTIIRLQEVPINSVNIGNFGFRSVAEIAQ